MDHESSPRPPRDYYKQLFPVVRFGLNRAFDRTTLGAENIPDTPALYVPNHIKFADSALVAAAYTEETGKAMRFGAKREYFDGDGLDDKGKLGRTMQWVMAHTHMIPVDREGGDPRAFSKLQAAVLGRLAVGDSVALHAEGTRSTDGRLHKFKSGAARIALEGMVPIVPVGIVYTEYSNHRRTHVDVSFGEPIMPEEYDKLPYKLLPKGPKAEHFIKVAEDRVANLTGMPQAGAFAQLRKNRHSEE